MADLAKSTTSIQMTRPPRWVGRVSLSLHSRIRPAFGRTPGTETDHSWRDPGLPIPLLSFFTGAGLLDIGFLQAGFEIPWHNEYKPSFAEGFSYGMESLLGRPVRTPNGRSIEELGPGDIIREAFGARTPPDLFGMIGGPPCPAFSVGGKNLGQTDPIGKLSQVYINRIDELQPTFFLFENVRGLLRTHRHRAFLESLWGQLAPRYKMELRVLNALEFGIPQDRQRVIWIGVHKRWLRRHPRRWEPLTPFAESTRSDADGPSPFPTPFYPNAKAEYPWPSTSPFGAEPARSNVPPELTAGYWILDPTLAGLPNQADCLSPLSDKLHIIDEGDTSRKSFKRLHRHRYSPTAAYGHNEVHLHPTLPRRLTVREAMRLQSVPDGYALPPSMSLTDKYKTIGNGVPVRLSQAIAKSLRLFLEV